MTATTRSLVAVNTAPDSENRMHGDEARRFGFRGGLVPGVDVLAYLAHEAVARWGASWLGGGRLTGRLDAPVYDGEAVEVVTTPLASGHGIEAMVLGPDAVTRARATLAPLGATDRGAAEASADPHRFPASPLPARDARPPVRRELLEPGTVLGTQEVGYHAARSPHYLDEISEDHAAFRERGMAHPGWLLRFANWALSETVALGPWIHVASAATFLAPVVDGDRIEVRALVTDRYERKGHEFVELDVLYLVDGQPVAVVDHRAIWRPRADDRPST